MRKCNFVNAIRLTMGILALVIAAYAFGVYQGHIAGASLSGAVYRIGGKWWSHMDPYPVHLHYARLVLFLLAGYCVLIPIHRASFWFFARISLLILAGFQLMRLLEFKIWAWNNNDDYLRVIQHLLKFEIVLSLFVIGIVVLEIVHFFQNRRGKENSSRHT